MRTKFTNRVRHVIINEFLLTLKQIKKLKLKVNRKKKQNSDFQLKQLFVSDGMPGNCRVLSLK